MCLEFWWRRFSNESAKAILSHGVKEICTRYKIINETKNSPIPTLSVSFLEEQKQHNS